MGIVYSNKRYVTYKEPDKLKEFRPSCILTHLESSFLGTKPISGWWGSPVDANFGWKDWCESEDYGNYDFDNPIYWSLEEGSIIFQIYYDEVELDINNPLLPYIRFKDWDLNVQDDMPIEAKINILKSKGYSSKDLRPIIDFNAMLDDNIVAVELLDPCIGHRFNNALEIEFNCWDCESIVVLDPSKIIFERSNNE